MFRSPAALATLASLAALLLATPAAQAQPSVAITLGGPGWALSVAPPMVVAPRPVLPPGWVVYPSYPPGAVWVAPAPQWRAERPERRHRHEHRAWRNGERWGNDWRGNPWRREAPRERGYRGHYGRDGD